MMIEQISSFCGQTVGNKKEGSGINANLIREYSVSKVHNSHKEIQGFTFSIMVRFFSAVEEPIVFKIKQTNILKISQSVLHLLVSI